MGPIANIGQPSYYFSLNFPVKGTRYLDLTLFISISLAHKYCGLGPTHMSLSRRMTLETWVTVRST